MVVSAGLKRIVLGLKLARAICCLTAPAAIVAVWSLWPAPFEAASPPDILTAVRPAPPIPRDNLDAYRPLWERDLKQPPIPESTALTETPKPSGPLPTLVATLVDSERRYAHLRGQSGRVQIRAIDEVVDRFRICAIEPGRVQLADTQGRVWIELPQNRDPRR